MSKLVKMRKIYLVPNLITTANMFCGFYSITASVRLDFLAAAWALVAAGIFDMLDGRIARLAKATSEFGVEYDSLSDMISFGVAPSVLVYLWALARFDRLGLFAAFLFMTCGALRLARFNIHSDEMPKGYFQGLPIPVAAGTLATSIIFHQNRGWTRVNSELVLVMTLGLSSLMVSSLRFSSFKELNWRSKASFGKLWLGLMVMILIAAKPEITMFLILASYTVLSVLVHLVRLVLKR